MSERVDGDWLDGILEAMQRIALYIDGLDYSSFLDDTKTQDAVIRNLEVIGEASKNLSPQFRLATPEIPWKNLAGMRDRLIHRYFGVNLDIVWQAASVELPALAKALAAHVGK